MRVLVFAVLFSPVALIAQFADGPANVRDKPNGMVLFEVMDYANLYVEEASVDSAWFKIGLVGYVLPTALIDRKAVKSGTLVFSESRDTIAIIKSQHEIINNNLQFREYASLKRVSIELKGWTYKSNIRWSPSAAELASHRRSTSWTCENSIFLLEHDNGLTETIIQECDLYRKGTYIDGHFIDFLVREVRKIRAFDGAEGQESEITLSFKSISNNTLNLPDVTFTADKLQFKSECIIATKFGCCASPDQSYMYSFPSMKKLMQFESDLLRIEIPNSRIGGWIAFDYAYNPQNGSLGRLFLVVNGEIQDTIEFRSNVPDFMKFPPSLKLVATGKDKVSNENRQIELWSQNSNKTASAISGFAVELEFWNDNSDVEKVLVPVIGGRFQRSAGDSIEVK